ncbi:MAG: cytochrome c [Anaerolineae bacterium]|jgi:cytochrome c
MKKVAVLLVFLLMIGLVAACGGDSAPAEDAGGAANAGDPAAGQQIFEQSMVGSLTGCASCHSLEPGVDLVGPSLANIGAEAGSRVSGTSADEYMRQSIVEPNAYVVEGYGEGIMPAGYGDQLSDEELNDLVAYLLSLE